MCSSDELHYIEELPAALVREWELSPDEALWTGSGVQWSAAAARCDAWRSPRRFSGITPPQNLRRVFRVRRSGAIARAGINEAGGVSPFLAQWPRRLLVKFRKWTCNGCRMRRSIWSCIDTLEHVPDPVRGLAECRRAKSGGACVFTVPIIVGRLTQTARDCRRAIGNRTTAAAIS